MFASREALDKYAVSDAHVKVVTENVKPNVEGMLTRVKSATERKTDHPDLLAYDFELDE